MNWKSEKQKEDAKPISIYLNYSRSLYAEFLWSFNKYTASYGVICVTLVKIAF